MALKWQGGYHRYRKYFTSLGGIYQQKQTRTYAGIVFSFLMVSFFIFFAIKPTLITITRLARQIEDQKKVNKQLQTKINALQEAQNEYTLIKNDLYLVDQALPEDSQISTLIKEIEALTRYANVGLETVRYGQAPLLGKSSSDKSNKGQKQPGTVKKDQASSVSFTLNLTGEYQSLKSFLESLSSLRRVITVESFIFKKIDEEGMPLILSLRAQAFYLEPE